MRSFGFEKAEPSWAELNWASWARWKETMPIYASNNEWTIIIIILKYLLEMKQRLRLRLIIIKNIATRAPLSCRLSSFIMNSSAKKALERVGSRRSLLSGPRTNEGAVYKSSIQNWLTGKEKSSGTNQLAAISGNCTAFLRIRQRRTHPAYKLC